MTLKHSIGFVVYFYVFVLKVGALSNTRVLYLALCLQTFMNTRTNLRPSIFSFKKILYVTQGWEILN